MSKQTMGIPAQQNYNELLHQNERQRETIKQLEKLCRDLHRGLVYALICAEVPLEGNDSYQYMKQRMDELGLFETKAVKR